MRELEDRYAAGRGNRTGLEQTIIATSLRFRVLCRFTAYVAIDRAAVVNEGGEVHQITQPVEMPAGWGEAAAVGSVCFTEPEVSPGIVGGQAMALPCSPPPAMSLSAEMLPPKGGPRLFSSRARRVAPPPPSTPEQWIARSGYELLEKLGEDSHGTLYKARDRRKRLVVVRLLKNPVKLVDPTSLERTLNGLKHPVIAPNSQAHRKNLRRAR